MSKYTNFNSGNLKEFRAIFNAKMAELQKETGVLVTIGNISYQDSSLRTTMKANIVNPDISGAAAKVNIAKAEFKDYCYRYGFNPADYGRNFVFKGETFMITGLKTRKQRCPILAQNNSGKTYKFSTDAVRKGFDLYESLKGNRTMSL